MLEEQLHELARKTMESINPNCNLSLDEFILEVPMTKEQLDLCRTVLGLFYFYQTTTD